MIRRLNKNYPLKCPKLIANSFISISIFSTMILQFTTKVLRNNNYFQSFQFATMDQSKMVNLVKKCIPPLDGTHHKGQAGRIGVIGGSLEYTGAPYFAAIAALKVGADLVHIFCTNAAAAVIKSYSPELIVHPLLDEVNAFNKISQWLERLHVVVIGPGLGREEKTFKVVSEIINLIREKQKPLIIDADGLFLITETPELIRNFTSPVVLTPNKIEFDRLYNKVQGNSGLMSLGKDIIILRKGESDELLCGHAPEVQWKYNIEGSGRRCGGQGDLLSGSLATFLHWTTSSLDKIDYEVSDKKLLASSLSCFAASTLIRSCNKKAFQKKGRSMLAADMIEFIHEEFTEFYGQ